MTMTSIKSYSELLSLSTFEERFQYLKLSGIVGETTFGYDRYLNQVLYNSAEWKSLRARIIIRDNGCDLACEGYEIHGRILIHHINPINVDDVLRRNKCVFDPENLICTVHNTHNAIHYSDEKLLYASVIERTKYDTCPWRL